MTLLGLLPRDDDWSGYLWFVVFVVVPLLARFFKWLFTRLGVVREADPAQAEAERRARLERAREERRQAEREGEDLWRRLARGELPEPQVRPEEPAVRPAPAAPRATSTDSLESEEPPMPLSVLGDVTEPSEAPEVSLAAGGEPARLEPLSAAVAGPTPAVPSRAAFVLAHGDLRRAIVLSEVLGPPVSDRALRA